MSKFDYILKSLKKRVTVEEAGAGNMVSDPRLGEKPVPFGFLNAKWEQFLTGLQDEDEPWEFSYWGGELCAAAGIVIIRNGTYVDHLTTRRS